MQLLGSTAPDDDAFTFPPQRRHYRLPSAQLVTVEVATVAREVAANRG
jgi:hypothetical protein